MTAITPNIIPINPTYEPANDFLHLGNPTVVKFGYMCKIDYDEHIENDYDGATIYPSEKALREHHDCCDECGIVKIRLTIEKIIAETNYSFH